MRVSGFSVRVLGRSILKLFVRKSTRCIKKFSKANQGHENYTKHSKKDFEDEMEAVSRREGMRVTLEQRQRPETLQGQFWTGITFDRPLLSCSIDGLSDVGNDGQCIPTHLSTSARLAFRDSCYVFLLSRFAIRVSVSCIGFHISRSRVAFRVLWVACHVSRFAFRVTRLVFHNSCCSRRSPKS